MKSLINKILVISIVVYSLSTTCFSAGFFTPDNQEQPYCPTGSDCSIQKGVDIVSKDVNEIEQNKKFSVYVQDIVAYAIGFIALLGVLFIIYAGFSILTSSGDEGKVKKSKSTILYVVLGMLLITLAYPIISFAIKMMFPTGIIYADIRLPSFIEQSYAYSNNDKNTFDEFKKQAELLASNLESDYKVNGKISSANLLKLQQIVNSAITTFPDNNDYIANTNIAKNLLISIEVVKKTPDSDSKIAEMAKGLNNFLTKIKIPRVTATISATPQSGNAPLNVSLRASSVLDPSGVIIPNANFIWWIKDSAGAHRTLGTGPSINFTFKDEKSYLVNLDIISSSKNSNGKIDTLPFNGQIKVDVLPSAGNIYFYINGVNVSDLDKLKITPGIGKAGLILDATASQASAGTRFAKTMWDFGNGNTIVHDLSPHIEKQYYTNEGNYKVSLSILTNEGKTITKTLYIEVRDPVASIKTDKNSGFVGDDFKFNVSTAFYDGQLSYEWKIIELTSNNTIFSSSNENISYKFRNTGKFAIKLKSRSASGREDIDTVVINIDSRDPVAAFEITQGNNETPNSYKFDATTSYDPDTFDSSKLQFRWLVDGQKVDLENPTRNGAVGRYTFNTEGTHKITLEVSNKDGKTSTFKRDTTVDSLLSVKLGFSPKIAKIGSPVTIIADSKEATIYEWNFGDSSTDTTNVGRINHIYKKSGTYDLNLTIRGSKGTTSNFITRKIYVSDGATPSSSILITRDNEEILSTEDACDGRSAFVLDRAAAVTFSAENSVNVDGNNNGLVYSWKYVGRNSSQQKFSYKFDELGCFPVDLTVKSQKNGKLNTTRVYIKIENLPPKITGLSLAPTDVNSDPVVVKVSANNAQDDDGVIVSYLWYYYTDSDPEPQDYRVTRVPNTTFVLPKITGKYYFVLIAEDSNGAKVNTDQLSEERYSIQLSTDNINTPLIKLTADKTSISTGDEVNFVVKVSDVLSRDISDKVEYKWDFDGDGFYDETTKTGKMTHKFNNSGNISFKVKVSYKGISNTKFQLISVKNLLKPNFEYYSIGNKIVLFNTSAGNYITATWDLGNDITSSNLNSFTYDFKNESFPTSVNLKVSDGTNSQSINMPVKKDVINKAKITRSKTNLALFSYPSVEDSTIHIPTSNDKLFLYLGESKGSSNTYCIDSDISIDSDLNGTADDDCDNKGTDSYTSGTPFVINDFNSSSASRDIKISLLNGSKVVETKSLKVVLDNVSVNPNGGVVLGDNKNISEADKLSIEQLKDLIKKSPEKDRLQMMKYLSSLQENWFDDREKTKVVIDFESFVNASSYDQKIKDEYYNLLEGFLVTDKQARTEITLAVKVLKSLIPKSNLSYTQIIKNIDEIMSHPTNTTINKDLGKFILEAVLKDNNIINKDKLIIKSQLQVIIYGSQSNIPKDQVVTPTTTTSTGFSILGFLFSLLKIFGYIILLIALGFVGLYGFFRVSNKNDNLSFQDFLIDLFTKGRGGDELIQEEVPFSDKIEQAKNDVLNNVTTEVSSKSEEQSSNTDSGLVNKEISDFDKKNLFQTIDGGDGSSNKLPDWLKGVPQMEAEPDTVAIPKDFITKKSGNTDSSTDEEVVTPTTEDTESQTETSSAKFSDFISEENTEEQPIEEEPISTEHNDSFSVEESVPEVTTELPVNEDSGLPAWLKGIDQDELNDEINEELSNDKQDIKEESIEELVNKEEDKIASAIVEDIPDDNFLAEESSFLAEEESITTPNVPEIAAEDDGLPDWLRGSAIPVKTSQEEEKPVVVESVEKKEKPVVKEVKKAEKKEEKKKENKSTEKNISTEKEVKAEKSDNIPKQVMEEKKKEDTETIKNIKPMHKKPKMFSDKKPEQILSENTDDLPDWLK